MQFEVERLDPKPLPRRLAILFRGFVPCILSRLVAEPKELRSRRPRMARIVPWSSCLYPPNQRNPRFSVVLKNRRRMQRLQRLYRGVSLPWGKEGQWSLITTGGLPPAGFRIDLGNS